MPIWILIIAGILAAMLTLVRCDADQAIERHRSQSQSAVLQPMDSPSHAKPTEPHRAAHTFDHRDPDSVPDDRDAADVVRAMGKRFNGPIAF